MPRPRFIAHLVTFFLFAGCSAPHLSDDVAHSTGADDHRRDVAAPSAAADHGSRYLTWQVYGGDPGQTRYASLDQINRDNVHRLDVAWTLDTGDAGPTIECNPIVVGGTMYLTSPLLKVIAVDAATGEERWRFDPFENYDGPRYWREVSRGLTYWSDEHRLFAGAGPFLYAVDAHTGVLIEGFGNGGSIDLREGLGRDPEDLEIIITSPGAMYRDLIIVGANVSESPGAAPGHIRAYDARSGALAWIFHTIPQPGEFGHDTWEGDSWKTAGGANAWAGFTVDVERGIVFAPTGAPTYDFYGGNRKGANLFANTLLALDAATGERIWHYQTVHHDVWDYDLPAPPNLVRVRQRGRNVDAVAQVTKTGFVFLLDRETGEPLFPIEERPVPQSDVPGEETWPTQPFPTKPPPFARQGITAGDLVEHVAVEEFERYRSEGLFTPGSIEGTLMLPGYLGGANWGGAAVDPTNAMMYVSASNFPSVVMLKKGDGEPAYLNRADPHFVDEDGYPAIKPPWGTLTAIDLNDGTLVWQVPLGTYPQHDAPSTGTLNLGGAIVTAGGLVFVGSTMDRMFRAYDADSGDVLWETQLPTGGMALPATYEVDGTQYVVIAAGGGVGMRGARPIETPPGASYVAFALPPRSAK